MLTGIDVSRYQTTTPSLTGYDFLIARAAYGTNPDGLFATHIATARRRGLVTGAYLFLRHGLIRAQVDRLLELVAQVGGVDLLAIDWESDGSSIPATSLEAREAIERIQSTGRAVGLYASTSRYPSDAFGADWRWVADYRPIAEPPIAWDVWQWTSSAGNLRLDRNRYRGTRAELVALGGQKESDVGQTFSIDPAAIAGTVTVTEAGHWYQALADPPGVLRGPINPDLFGDHRAFGPVTPIPPIKGHPGERAYLVGTMGALVLEADAVFTPDPSIDVDAILEAAAIRAAQAVRAAP